MAVPYTHSGLAAPPARYGGYYLDETFGSVQSYAYPHLPEELWRRGWSVWSCQRRRARMAQFIVDHLHRNSNGRWIDIGHGKFELYSWPEIAQEWYKMKDRGSDICDATSMLRKGLPRAFPNLKEIKEEAEKDGTQYVKRVFQAPPALMSEVFRCALHPTNREEIFYGGDHTVPQAMQASQPSTYQPVFKQQPHIVPHVSAFSASVPPSQARLPDAHLVPSGVPYMNDSASGAVPSPSNDSGFHDRLDSLSLSSSSSPAGSLQRSQQESYKDQIDFFEGEEKMNEDADSMMGMSLSSFNAASVLNNQELELPGYPEFPDYDELLNDVNLVPAEQPATEPKGHHSQQLAGQNGQWNMADTRSQYSQPQQGYSPQSPPGLIPQADLPGGRTPTNPSDATISPVPAVQRPQVPTNRQEPAQLNIQLSPVKGPLQGGSQIYVFHVDPEPLPEGQYTLVFYSPALHNGQAVTATRFNLFILIATVPPHIMAEVVTVHLVIDGIPRGSQQYQYIDADFSNSGEMIGQPLYDNLYHMQGMIGSLLQQGERSGASGSYPTGQQGGQYHQQYMSLLQTAVSLDQGSLVRLLLSAPFAGAALCRPLSSGQLMEDYAKKKGRPQVAYCMQSIRERHECLKAGETPPSSLPDPLLLLESRFSSAAQSVASLCHSLQQLSMSKPEPKARASAEVPAGVLRQVQAREAEKVDVKEEVKEESASPPSGSGELSAAQYQHYVHTVSQCNVLKNELKQAKTSSRKAAMLEASYCQVMCLLQEHCIHAYEQRNEAATRLFEARAESSRLKERVAELEKERDAARQEKKDELKAAADQNALLRENMALREYVAEAEREKQKANETMAKLRQEKEILEHKPRRATVRTKRRYFRDVKKGKGVESGYQSTSMDYPPVHSPKEEHKLGPKKDSAFFSGGSVAGASAELQSQESLESESPEELQVLTLPGLTADVKDYGLTLERVIYVHEIKPGSLADQELGGKLQAGDQIVAVNNQELLTVLTAEETQHHLQAGSDKVELTIYSTPVDVGDEPASTHSLTGVSKLTSRSQPRRLGTIQQATTPTSPAAATVLPFGPFGEKESADKPSQTAS